MSCETTGYVWRDVIGVHSGLGARCVRQGGLDFSEAEDMQWLD